jgi:beta-glucanase (GH16 family)
MNKYIITLGLIFIAIGSFSQKYKLVWEDNFDKPELSKYWSADINDEGGGNRELQFYRPENIFLGKEPVSGKNCLIITAKKESYQNKQATSGRITTFGNLFFRYGKLVSRIKMPKTANGLWPAFWMLGMDHNESKWPKCGEIDIVEMGQKDGIKNNVQDRYFNGACHWGESWNSGKYPNKGVFSTSKYSLQDDFHTYTLIWTPDSIKMYLDQDKYPKVKPYFELPIVGKNLPNETSRYFKKPYYVIFNVAVGGNFTDIFDIEKVTALKSGDASMYVDYVRLYQRGDKEEILTLKKDK